MAEGHLNIVVRGQKRYYTIAGSEAATARVVEASSEASGYYQVEDTDWWEGAAGAALVCGKIVYQPELTTASLTLAAVYDAEGQPCYWLAVTAGRVILRGADGTVRTIPDVRIPASQGARLGDAALVVGRLFPPTSAEYGRPRPHWPGLAKSCGGASDRLGYLLALYQRHYGLSDGELRATGGE